MAFVAYKKLWKYRKCLHFLIVLLENKPLFPLLCYLVTQINDRVHSFFGFLFVSFYILLRVKRIKEKIALNIGDLYIFVDVLRNINKNVFFVVVLVYR